MIAVLLPALLPAQMLFSPLGMEGPQLTPPSGNTPPEQKCVLEGRVTNAQTGEPVKKAMIRLTRRGSGGDWAGAAYAPMRISGQQGYSATSDADGSFRIEAIEPGDYNLYGERTGYLNSAYGAKRPMGLGTILTLRPAQQMSGVSLALIPQAVITGKVVDDDGDPVTGTVIQALGQMWQRGKLRYLPRGGTNSNDLGEFRLANLSPGKYYLCAQKMNFGRSEDVAPAPGKPDIRPVRTCYPDAATVENAASIEVNAGQDVSGIDVHLRTAQTFHVRGKVVGIVPGGDLQRVSINLAPRGEQMLLFGSMAAISKDQSFDLAGVVPGSYTLNAFVLGGNVRGIAHQPVDVGQGDVNDVVLAISPPGSLRGTIRLEGTPQAGTAAVNLGNVHASLISADAGPTIGPLPEGHSNADGIFTLDNVLPGKYYVQAGAPAGTYLKSVRFGQQEILGKELDLSQSAAGDLEILFRYGAAEVDGTLQPAENSAAAGVGGSTAQATAAASIVLIPDVLNADGSGMHFGSTNQNGAFTLKNIPPGHYRAYAFEDIHADQLENPDVLKQLESRGTEVEVKENDRKQIELPLISSEDVQQIFAQLGIDSSQ